jgi:hypothetical protein
MKAQHAVTEWLHKGRTGPLYLSYMGLTALPPLPPDLMDLRCVGNALIALPPLPLQLRILDVTDNRLTSLPLPLPQTLEQLYCSRNHLTDEVLPPLDGWPPRLHTFHCNRNRLRQCPEVPAHASRRLVGVCWTFRPHLLRGEARCPCCGQPAGTFGPSI